MKSGLVELGLTKVLGLVGLLFALLTSAASAQPVFNKTFSPNTIGPGSVSTITFTITNNSPAPVTGLAFVDTLPVVPGPLTIADPANVSTDCDLGTSGTLSAPDGGSAISLSDARIGGSQSCTIRVDVAASTPGAHTNPAITLSSSAGSSMSLAVDLTVVTTLPGFSKSFAPSSVSLGGRSTLTFTIDNTLNASSIGSLDFTDNLPAGMIVADPANASTDCVAASLNDTTVTANPGSGVITLDANGNNFFAGFEVLPVGASCTVVVDVTASGGGSLDNVTNPLLADFASSGRASDTLNVTVTPLALTKSFTDDPVPPGGTVTLEFGINNFDRDFPATDIAFTDDLGATLAGLTFSSLLSNDCGGTVSGVGGTTLGLSGGTVAAQASCTIRASLMVPAGATPGVYTNSTSSISGTVNGSPVAGNAASDDLFVEPVPLLTKEFLEVGTLAPDPIINAGEDVIIRFTVANTSATSAATDIAFNDELTDGGPSTGFLPFPVSVTLPPIPNPPCGVGSSVALTFVDTDRQALSLTGGNLTAATGAGSSCTFDVTVTVPADLAPNIYTNTTQAITATVDGATRVGEPASDTLTVVAAPSLIKAFTDDPVAPGGTVTLEFSLSHSANAASDATNIAFTDDLNSVLAGLTANLPPTPDPPCGPGSSLTGSAGDTLLTLMGGTLTPGETCTFSVSLNVPAGAAAGSFANTTSGVSATVMGLTATAPAASDNLQVAGLTFSKEFIGNPVLPGETTTLRFTIDNISPNATDDATSIFFTDSLSTALTGLAATGGPSANTCGGTLSGTTFLIYVGGSLLIGENCTIDVPVLVPAGAADGDYANITSNLTATVNGAPTVIDPAIDILTVESDRLSLSKVFTDAPIAAGDSVTLEFTLTNLDATQAASAIDFTDDLGAVLAGLTFDSVLLDDCSGTVTGTGTDLITVSGASLAAGGSCTITASLTVPAATAAGIYTNTTSLVTGTIGGLATTGDPANADLEVLDLLLFSKSFDGPSTATGTSTLTFTITNPGANAVGGVAFSDDLDAVISGLVATNLPLTDVCGAGSVLSGTSFLTLTGANLPPTGGMCSFDVELLVPATATPGTFLNTTSDLSQSGLKVADPATADLVIEPPPGFSKAFSPATIQAGVAGTLTFTIDNSASTLAASALAFSDLLPTGVTVALAPNGSTTCTGGTLTAAAGTSVIDYTGGSVGAGASCTIQVDVIAGAAGTYVNTTGDLTSSSGNSGTANATLTALPTADKSITVSDGITSAVAGGSLVYTIVAANSGPDADPAVSVTDTFPTDLTCTYTSVAAGGATGNTAAGAGDLAETLSMPIGSSVTYTVSCNIDSAASGTLSNTATISGSVTDLVAANDSATDGDTVLTSEVDLAVTKTDGVTFAIPGVDTLTYTIVATNNGPSDDGGVLFADIYPTDLNCTFTNVFAGGAALVQDFPSAIEVRQDLSMPAASSVTYTVDCSISPTATGTVSNTATVTTTSTDPDTTNNSATDNDTVLIPPPLFSKQFAPNPIVAGAVSTLSFTIDNTASPIDASGIDFTDNLPATVLIATPNNEFTDCVGGTLTTLEGTGVVSYTGGTATAGSSCTVSVDVTSATVASHNNTSGDLTSSLGNSGMASDTLIVNAGPVPGFVKDFSPSILVQGARSTLTFTINNTTSLVDANNLNFTDNLPSGLVVGTPAMAMTSCVGGALTAIDGGATVGYSGGSVSSGDSCTIGVDVVGNAAGNLLNTSGDLTSSLGNSGPASATLTVNAAPLPSFFMAFAPATVLQGDSSTLTFTIDNSTSLVDADNLDFSNNLPNGLLVATPANGTTSCVGGTLIAATGSATISYAGGSISMGNTCTISVDVTAGAAGSLLNTSGDLTSSLGNSGPTSATLIVDTAPLPGFSKVFTPSTIPQGGSSTLTLTIDNSSSSADADDLGFTDNLPTGLSVATPANATTDCVAGTLTAAAGSALVSYTAGSVLAGTSCSVSVEITGSVAGSYTNTTSDLTSSLGNSGTASAILDIVGSELNLSKAFLSSPVLPGGTVELEFTINNNSATLDATAIAFDDDLNRALAGLAAVGLPLNDVCGAGNGVLAGSNGNTQLSFSNGALAAGATCAFTVTLQVPANAMPGAYSNITGPLSADVGGLSITSAAASADLTIAPLSFTKTFASQVTAGDTVALEFTISNPDPVNSATGIGFVDDLDAFLPGATALLLPIANACGTGSSLAGDSVISLSDGNLGPGASCTFTVTVAVPETASGGSYLNVTEPLQTTVGGTLVAGATTTAQGTLVVIGTAIAVPALSFLGMLLMMAVLLLAGWIARNKVSGGLSGRL